MPSSCYADEFDICVSISDLVSWVKDEYSPNADLAGALSLAGIDLDLAKLYECYMERTPVGTGDVHVYSSLLNKSFLVIDLYRDLTDQLDLVSASLRLDRDLIGTWSKLCSLGSDASLMRLIAKCFLANLTTPTDYAHCWMKADTRYWSTKAGIGNI
ncbi:hypothetical protein [Pseudomonas quasicaspiana]|uniref:hypothetical protein n=1 Tax=Pseudomonas quasicaspiana TaxID=2829821 RepID=UPI001E3EBCD2|nr:hypothetical protein [Pseudomonas quasicaspiana]